MEAASMACTCHLKGSYGTWISAFAAALSTNGSRSDISSCAGGGAATCEPTCAVASLSGVDVTETVLLAAALTAAVRGLNVLALVLACLRSAAGTKRDFAAGCCALPCHVRELAATNKRGSVCAQQRQGTC